MGDPSRQHPQRVEGSGMRNIGNERNFLGPQLGPTELTLAGGGGGGRESRLSPWKQEHF